MSKLRLDKVKHLIDSGFFFYSDGKVYRTKKINSHGAIVVLAVPERAGHSTKRGYRRVVLKPHTVYEHVLIYALVFGVEALSRVECVDHLNAIKSDNRIENLEGVSLFENNKRAEQMGLVTRTHGKLNGCCKLSSESLTSIKSKWDSGKYRQYEIAGLFGISQSHVSCIVNGKSRRFG